MWLVKLFPEWMFLGAAAVSVLALLILPLLKFPLLNKYRTLAGYVATFILIVSVYISGALLNEAKWEKEVLKKDLQISQLETKAAQKTTEVVEKVVTKVIKVKGETREIIKNVPVYITKEDDSKCDIPNSFVQLHDMAAQGKVPDSTSVPDAGTSDIKLSGVATTVSENYGTCREIREKYLGLQDWVREQEKIWNEK
jgi:hypothetical protein